MSKIPHFSKEKNNTSIENRILIIDKVGVIGQFLCQRLAGNSLVVFVSQKQPDSVKDFTNIILVPYGKKFPTLPDDIYFHILVIDDQTQITRGALETLIKKSKKDNSVFVFATYLQKADKQLIANLVGSYKKSFVVIYGDVFHKTAVGNVGEFKSIANKFIYQAATTGKIEVIEDGLLKTYPVFMEDLVFCIADKVFKPNRTSQIFKIFPKHYRTQISLAHMIQKPNPTVHIDFVKDYEHEGYEYPKFDEGEYLLEESYPLESKIRQIDLGQKNTTQEKESKLSKTEVKNKYRVFLFRFLFLFITLLLLPFITTASFFFLGVRTIDGAKKAIDEGDLHLAQQLANNSKTFFDFSEKSSTTLLFETKFLGLDKKTEQFLNNINFAKTTSLSIQHSLEAVKKISDVFNGTSKNPKEDFGQARNLMKNSIIFLREIEAEGKIPNDIKTQIRSLDTLVRLISNTIDIWPDIFGFNGKKEYLVLLQNNMELRPGGGFIGSYVTLVIKNGKILDFSIHDTYDADGQLKGHVEPPYALRRFLPIPHFYLRDSNFDLDFTKAASSSALMLNLETGKMVDGVIGVDLSFVKSLIGALGSVYVGDYKETVNKDNLFLFAESHAEKNFFPGSAQKKDFLNSLFSSIKTSLENKKKISYGALAKSINDSINQKHLLFAFDNQEAQDIFTVNNWSSSVWDERESNPLTINDFFGINEANLGANKANYFIKRKVSQDASIFLDGTVAEKISISYFNASTPNKWPGGDYKNYLRIILPKNASLDEVKVDGEEQNIVTAITSPLIYEAKNFLPPRGLEVDRTKENGKTIYGFLIIIPSGKVKTITVKYTLSQRLSLGTSSLFYSLRVFKQPGTDGYPFEFSLTYPQTYNITSYSQGINKKDNMVFLSRDLLSNEDILVKFAVE